MTPLYRRLMYANVVEIFVILWCRSKSIVNVGFKLGRMNVSEKFHLNSNYPVLLMQNIPKNLNTYLSKLMFRI